MPSRFTFYGMNPRAILEGLYRVGTGAANGHRLTHAWMQGRPSESAPWIIAVGKAAPAMLAGALDGLRELGHPPCGTLCISHATSETNAAFKVAMGDHPIPGERSAHCAQLLAEFVKRIPADAQVIVLLSGGTSSLIAAPIEGISSSSLSQLFDALLASGEPIDVVNAIRRRFLRWGAGRLAEALEGRSVQVVVLSDVLSGNLAAIGSGPCTPDPLSAADLLGALRVEAHLPHFVASYLESVQRGELPESPKYGQASFAHVEHTVIGNNRTALQAVIAEGRRAGLQVLELPWSITEEATTAGVRFARFIARLESAENATLIVAGGEPTVTLGANPGVGGRCQALSLAAAGELHARGATRAHILAAGTDGRDGPTNAAGAIVSAVTWERAEALGLGPQKALARHATHDLLEQLGALLPSQVTDTNVNDLFLGLLSPLPSAKH